MRKLYLISLTFLLQVSLSAQTPDVIGRQPNTITTAVPFLLISPDPVGAAMGEAGVATSNNAFSLYWNPAKYAATSHLLGTDPTKDLRVAVSYAPWLRSLVKDIWLGSIYGSKLLSENSAVSASFRYFTLGDIIYTTIQGDVIGNYKPSEWAADLAYSQRLSEHWYGGVALRFIYSNLTSRQTINGTETKHGTSVAADLSAYYEKPLGDNTLSFGASIANIGNKISYFKNNEYRDFIPTILRIGPSFNYKINEIHQLRFSVEIAKLLVPTPPYYATDSISGQILLDENNDPVILKGKSSDVSVLRGMIQSFYDAPDGFSEEMNEITTAIGIEYRLFNVVSFRGGYFHENETKGNRKYFTAGIGAKYKYIEVNLAKIIDTDEGYQIADLFRKPENQVGNTGILHRTMRYSIAFDLAGIYN